MTMDYFALVFFVTSPFSNKCTCSVNRNCCNFSSTHMDEKSQYFLHDFTADCHKRWWNFFYPVTGDSNHCFVVPKVCDIYDGGYADGSDTYRLCIPRKDAQDPKLLTSKDIPTPSKVCKVPVGVGTTGQTSWWATCNKDCYVAGTSLTLAIDCPKARNIRYS